MRDYILGICVGAGIVLLFLPQIMQASERSKAKELARIRAIVLQEMEQAK